ncbi:hypothetical protein AKO1_011085 [Acrasis kona]|uniref:Sestrin n=1 Tax=Acrasis kona TaxID=1008807 RepID=A0AAW2YSP2_9EUKA
MKPGNINTDGQAINKNLNISSDDALSVTPDWLKNSLINQYEDHKSQQNRDDGSPSPHSPKWARFEDPTDTTLPSTAPMSSMLGTSPNWMKDNIFTGRDDAEYNVYNDQDEESQLNKYKNKQRKSNSSATRNTPRQQHEDDLSSEDSDSELSNVTTPQLYSQEIDEGVTLSESHLFRQCLHPNVEKRKQGVTNVIDVIKTHLTEYIKNAKQESQEDLLQPNRFFNRYRSIIARFAYDCPFEDISTRFQEVAALLIKNGISIQKPTLGYLNSPSWFFKPTSLETINNKQPGAKTLFCEFFLENGIVANHSRVLMAYPQFAEVFFNSYHFIMRNIGPLPITWRNYIGIMAASRHNCHYIVRRQEAEFLSNGGDPTWLKGIKYAPHKIQNLLKYNQVLAHQPWTLTEQHVEVLCKGADAWSIAELVHAVVIMCHFHSMSGFVYGNGILPDNEPTNIDLLMQDIDKLKKTVALEGESLKVVETLHKISGDYEEENTCLDPIIEQTRESSLSSQFSHKRIKSHDTCPSAQTFIPPSGVFANLNNYDCFVPPPYASMTYWNNLSQQVNTSSDSTQQTRPEGLFQQLKSQQQKQSQQNVRRQQQQPGLERYVADAHLSYTDFDVRSKDYNLLSAQEYNWKDHAFTMLNRFYNGSADLLDMEFDLIYNLTEKKFNKVTNIDTSAFRSAIWFYVHRLYGMMHDDFNYESTNLLLNINLKKYIKTVTCYPERTRREQWIDMGFSLRNKEKIHLNMLCVEARKQMELCYGLQVINAYMTRQYSH